MAKATPTQEYLNSLFNYNTETGILSTKDGFPLLSQNSNGYRRVSIDGTDYVQHRIIWKMVYGYDTLFEIDHLNGFRNDNSISNIREASISNNRRNRGIQSNNSTGVTGVHTTKYGTYRARIEHEKKVIWLGSYKTIEAAVDARAKAEAELFGEFRRLLETTDIRRKIVTGRNKPKSSKPWEAMGISRATWYRSR